MRRGISVIALIAMVSATAFSEEDVKSKVIREIGKVREINRKEIEAELKKNTKKISELTDQLTKEATAATEHAVKLFQMSCKEILPLKKGVTRRTLGDIAKIDAKKMRTSLLQMLDKTELMSPQQKELVKKHLGNVSMPDISNMAQFILALNSKDKKQVEFARMLKGKLPIELMLFNYDDLNDYSMQVKKFSGMNSFPGMKEYIGQYNLKVFPTLIRIEHKGVILIEGIPEIRQGKK